MTFGRHPLIALIIIIPFTLSGRTALTESPKSVKGCSGPGFHQLDFWIGQWNVFDFGGSTKVAEAAITRVQDGCALREQYFGTDSSNGESLTTYDPTTQLWHQVWISNHGQIVIIEGTLNGGSITLTGPEYGGASGRLVRGSWKPAADGTVRETAERSEDTGHTWSPWFDIVFRANPSGTDGALVGSAGRHSID